MVLPSKELLSAVLGEDVYEDIFYASDDIRTTFINGNNLVYSTSSAKFTGNNINIYELMHMMKEYIKSQNLMIIVYHHLDTVAVEIVQNQKSIYTSPGMSVYTEPEAVTKSCEWILEQQK